MRIRSLGIPPGDHPLLMVSEQADPDLFLPYTIPSPSESSHRRLIPGGNVGYEPANLGMMAAGILDGRMKQCGQDALPPIGFKSPGVIRIGLVLSQAIAHIIHWR